MLVSSMDTVWAGTITPPRGKRVASGDWSRRGIELKKGEEMGRFNMGSTVILLLPPGAVSNLENLGDSPRERALLSVALRGRVPLRGK